MPDHGDDGRNASRPSLVATRHGAAAEEARPREELGATLAGHADERPASSEPTWPKVDRYELRARLGAGGMGAVYEAYDPSLHRTVAVKVLHAEMPKVAQRRMQREALALARLSHPNVVQVFEVGQDGGRTFIAMELVRGRTLEAWARRRPAWRECVRAYAQVGAGVAAAHDAGLVHRDLKPSNCILGDDGRVRVVDFGLAKDSGQEGEDEAIDAAARSRPAAALEPGITAWGAMVGTPAYMAPEQLAGGPGSPASDQFSLCASLWEALYGQRPYHGETLGELSMRLLTGTIAEPPADARVPRWLREVVTRGLAREPGQRWPSVRALLDALEHGQLRARRRRIAWAVGLGGVTLAALAGGQRWDQARRVAACEAEGASIAAVWNDEAAEAIRAALVGTGVARAEVTAEAVRPWLDAQAQAWSTARTEACLDANVSGTLDVEVLERARWCLEERRMELEALVTELASPRPGTVDRAVKAAAGLSRVEPCRDVLGLSRLPIPSADARETAVSVRAALSNAGALQRLGAYDDGLAQARAALAQAEALAWPPLVADAKVRVGMLLERKGDYRGAEQALEDAFFTAVRAEAVEVAADAAARLVYVVGTGLRRHDDGDRWSRHEEAIAAALPDPVRSRSLRRLSERANLRLAEGDYAEAKALGEEALALAEEQRGAEHPDVGTIVHNLAAAEDKLGHYAAAEALAERAVRIRRRVLGPEHPDVATSLNHLGMVQGSMGRHEDAIVSFEHAIHVHERALGSEHPKLAVFLANLAHSHQGLGQLEEARLLHEHALLVSEAALGPDHPDLVSSLAGLGSVLGELGAHDDSVLLYERALRIGEAGLGPQHPVVAGMMSGLAKACWKQGNAERARTLYEAALRRWEAALGPEHPELAYSLLGLAEIALAQGRAADAVTAAERALRVRASSGAAEQLVAGARLTLANALWDSRQDRARAVLLVEQARATYAKLEDLASVAVLDAWLALRA